MLVKWPTEPLLCIFVSTLGMLKHLCHKTRRSCTKSWTTKQMETHGCVLWWSKASDHQEDRQYRQRSLRWRHNDHAGVSNHQPHGCLLNRLFRRKSKKTLKLRVTGLCAGNSPGAGEFPAQMASYAENVSIWWRHHVIRPSLYWTSFIQKHHIHKESFHKIKSYFPKNYPVNSGLGAAQ